MTTSRARLGNVDLDALIECEPTLSADVPQYPTEDGFTIQDAVLAKPRVFKVVAVLTEGGPVSTGGSGGSLRSRMEDLEKLFIAKRPIVFRSKTATYKNVCISSLSFKQNPNQAFSVDVSIELTEVRIVTASRTEYMEQTYSNDIANTAKINGIVPMPDAFTPDRILYDEIIKKNYSATKASDLDAYSDIISDKHVTSDYLNEHPVKGAGKEVYAATEDMTKMFSNWVDGLFGKK